MVLNKTGPQSIHILRGVRQQQDEPGRFSICSRQAAVVLSLDPTAGHEQQGTRPVLIVTPAAFNRVTRLPVVVPVTSGGNFARTAGFAVSLDGVGIRTTGVVRCDQPRTIDMKARGGKRLERVPETIMNEVLGRLSTILT